MNSHLDYVSQKRIGFLGFDGVTASHLTAPADAFAAAVLSDGFGNRIPCYEVHTISINREAFHAESGVIFRAQNSFRNAPPLDTLIIPGGSGLRRPEVSEKISDWILKRAPTTRRIASICTGIYGLAPTGLLDGRNVTTHWRFATDVARRFPKLHVNHKRLLVKDGAFYTSTGLTAGIDLSLALIEEDYGKYVALATAQEMVTPLTQRASEQKPTDSPDPNSTLIDRFADLVAWIVRNLHGNLSVDILARRACMCPQHFSRVFKSFFGTPPSEFIENLRLHEARRRLSTQRKTLQTIAVSVGFQNTDSFHRAFARRFGTRPSRYLQKTQLEEALSLSPGATMHSAQL